MKQRLLEKLQHIQNKIKEKGEGLRHVEKLAQEAKKAFDEAIETLMERKNFFQEVKVNKHYFKQWKIGFFKTVFPLKLRHLVSIPFIYVLIFPVLFLHITLEVYHQICFRLYRIPRVDPREFFIYDRHLLPYLNWFEKINCIFCSYVNNVFGYAVEIGARTERYWCPIKYARKINMTHSQYPKFVDYLDAKNFRKERNRLRDFSDVKEIDKKRAEELKKLHKITKN